MNQKNINDLFSAIYQIAEERGLSEQVVIDQIKQAYIAAYKKMYGDDEMDLTVEIETDKNNVLILANKKVVSLVTNPKIEISESQAKLIDPNLREGDRIQIDVTPQNFGRIATKVAFQKLLQGLRNAELNTALSKYSDKVGKIISGVIIGKGRNHIRVEIDKVEAILPLEETIPTENYKINERKRFLLLELLNTETEKKIILSRASDKFLEALFEIEIPEISTQVVNIVKIAREPGSRAKIAVMSKHDKVDPIGSCIGPKGTRIETIMREIEPEKIDIVLYVPEDPRTYIANALNPAKVLGVKLIEENKALVLVEESALSLAIGKDGQNVRLAAKLTGYNIDITSEKDKFNGFKDQFLDAKNEDMN